MMAARSSAIPSSDYQGSGDMVLSNDSSQHSGSRSSRSSSIAEQNYADYSHLAATQLAHQQQQRQNEKISVKERTKTFNRMASQVELDSGRAERGTGSGDNSVSVNGLAAPVGTSGSGSSAFAANSSVKRRNSRTAGPMSAGERQSRGSSSARSQHGGDDNETSSISTLDQTCKQWMVKSAQGDYHAIAKMLKEDPRLAKHKDFVSGYTALHWVSRKVY